MFPKAELEATPAVVADVQNGPFELEGSTVVPTGPGNRASQVSELDGTSSVSNRVSAMTTANGSRWSAVSSLKSCSHPSPPTVTVDAAGGTPLAADLQVVSQQHYGSTGQHYTTPQQQQESLYRLSSSRLSTMAEDSGESPSAPSPSTVEQSKENSPQHGIPQQLGSALYS